MSQKYSVNEILKAVDSINPYKPSSKKFAKEEILDAVTELYNSQSQKQTQILIMQNYSLTFYQLQIN